MKIGYSAEDSTHRAIITGLRNRWCPDAELVPGHSRGTTKQSRRREVPKIFEELALKGVDAVVVLSDGDGRPWRDVKREEDDRVPGERRARAVVGIADRNGECWICTARDYVAACSGRMSSEFDVDDPKGVFESAFSIDSTNRREPEIAHLVQKAPLHRWLSNDSFRGFYGELRALSQRQHCDLENLLERSRGQKS